MINDHHRVAIMGILNVTPDSFSDGGKFVEPATIIRHVEAMITAGADIIDIGGESTRPGAKPVTEAEELLRVIPAIAAIRKKHDIAISIDTTKALVAAEAIKAGANIVNDISALRFDDGMLEVVRKNAVPVIIMHMQGTPEDMQISPKYQDLIQETIEFFQQRISLMTKAGIPRESIIIDPGLGFGKTLGHNLSIIKNLTAYKSLNCQILVGHSRKSMFGTLLGNFDTDRDPATAAMSAILAINGASIIRVHNIALNREAVMMADAVIAAA